jgi:uncharacterized membrane protein
MNSSDKPSLTVWLYPTAFGAEASVVHLRSLVQRGAIRVHDAATIVWMPHDKEPLVRPVDHKTRTAAGRGALWGALVGLVVLNPVAGAAAGAGAGAAIRRARSAGLDEELVQDIRAQVTPGTSALVVLSSDADPAAVGEVLRNSEGVLLQAELTAEARRILEEMGLPEPDETQT